jgi:hypothetical protein
MESLPYISNSASVPLKRDRELQISGAKKRRYLDDLLAINSRRQAA